MKVDNIYSDFFQKTKCAVFILKNNLIYYANKSSLKMFGYSDEEIKSLHPSDLSPLYQEDGEASIIKADRMLSIAIQEGNKIFEWQHVKKDGTIFGTEIVLTLVQQEDDVFVVALIKDISKRKVYQMKLKMALEEQDFLINNIADFIYKIDKKGDLTYVSKSVINLTGYTSESWMKDSRNYLTIVR